MSVNDGNKLRQALRIIWSVICIFGGAYVIEKMSVISPNISAMTLPLYFVLVLAILYMGHLLIDAIRTESPTRVTWLPVDGNGSSIGVWASPEKDAGFALATFAVALVTTMPIGLNSSIRVRETIEVQRNQAIVPPPSIIVHFQV